MSDGPDGLISVLCEIVFAFDAVTMLYGSRTITGRSPVDVFPLSVESVTENVVSPPSTCIEHALMRRMHTQMPGYRDHAANINQCDCR